MIDSDIWYGLACLKANPEVRNFRRFGKGKGAYVNIVAWADSRAAFEEKVKLGNYKMRIVRPRPFFLNAQYTTGPSAIAITPPIKPKRSLPSSATRAITTGAPTT